MYYSTCLDARVARNGLASLVLIVYAQGLLDEVDTCWFFLLVELMDFLLVVLPGFNIEVIYYTFIRENRTN
jgi:hypothetical protein